MLLSNIIIAIHRLAHLLHRVGVPLVPEMLAYMSRLIFGCYIGPGARIGRSVALGYGGLGVVIHGESVIGDQVHIGTGVTLGGRSKVAGAPSIGDRCSIGGGAKILGPIKIANECVVGANAVVVRDVEPRCIVAGIPAVVIKTNINIADYHNGIRQEG